MKPGCSLSGKHNKLKNKEGDHTSRKNVPACCKIENNNNIMVDCFGREFGSKEQQKT